MECLGLDLHIHHIHLGLLKTAGTCRLPAHVETALLLLGHTDLERAPSIPENPWALDLLRRIPKHWFLFQDISRYLQTPGQLSRRASQMSDSQTRSTRKRDLPLEVTWICWSWERIHKQIHQKGIREKNQSPEAKPG